MNILGNKAILGVIAGIVVAFFVTFGGWAGLFWLILFAALGGVIGAQLDGRLDIAEVISAGSGRGRG